VGSFFLIFASGHPRASSAAKQKKRPPFGTYTPHHFVFADLGFQESLAQTDGVPKRSPQDTPRGPEDRPKRTLKPSKEQQQTAGSRQQQQQKPVEGGGASAGERSRGGEEHRPAFGVHPFWCIPPLCKTIQKTLGGDNIHQNSDRRFLGPPGLKDLWCTPIFGVTPYAAPPLGAALLACNR